MEILLWVVGISALLVLLYFMIRRAVRLDEEERRFYAEKAKIEYAKAGEIVTCETGHEICEVAKTLHVGDLIQAEQFINWRDREAPEPRDPIDAYCKTCGERYIRGVGGYQLHFADGWRSRLDKQVH